MPVITQINLLKNRRTRIIATLGPATASPEHVRSLVEAGANIFRLNMSHGDHEFHKRCHEYICQVREDLGKPIGVMADLCGPKIRTGRFEQGQILLKSGETVTVTTREVEGKPGLIPSQYAALHEDVRSGDRILLNDGNLELRVRETQGTEILCDVIHGGALGNHKGINLPGVHVSASSLTDKDREDAVFACGLGVDYLALSFVRTAEDVLHLKTIIQDIGQDVWIISKIEKPEALQNAEAILEATDAIMVARGDLGVELSPEEVPIAQKKLIQRARSRCKPVIVATQMLESMIEHARPTRAEVSDVANAVMLSADAVMLSGETAVGQHPLETVKMMDRIGRQTEAHQWLEMPSQAMQSKDEGMPIWNAVADAVSNLSHDLRAHAVIVLSTSGISAATMSAARPKAPIIAITDQEHIQRRMTLSWGIIPLLREDALQQDPASMAREIAKELGLAKEGENILLVRGFHSDPKLNTPSIMAIHM